MKTKKILGQASWQLRSTQVEAWLTCLGGHLAPVTFRLKGRDVRPYAIAPWAEEKLPPAMPAVLRALRGDFFCLPFGGPGDVPKKESFPLHGDAANGRWRKPRLKRTGDRTTLSVELDSRVPRGRVTKEITVRDGQHAVYSRHVLSGMSGPVTFSHHPMVQFPAEPGSGLIATSPIHFGQVSPSRAADPTKGGYSSLAPGAFFKSLRKVPKFGGGFDDVTVYPARIGYEDFVLLASVPKKIAWTTVTFPKQGYVWFALRDPKTLPSTFFWFSNAGLHGAPASGRLRGILGVEDMAYYFGSGQKAALGANAFTRRGHPTHARLDPQRPTVVNTITGVAAIPRGFGRVTAIQAGAGTITLISGKKRVVCAVDHEFLQSRDGR